jgi:SAM-dependent methyltransferase
MFDFHLDRFEYFRTQTHNTEKYVIPFIEQNCPALNWAGAQVLEVGSAEGGVLKAFVNIGCLGTGVEPVAIRVAQSREYLEEDIAKGKITLYQQSIFDSDFEDRFSGKFDLIILKDVIEHIHGQELLLKQLQTYLKPSGVIYFGFPPWRMPFGGHQQICKSKFLSRLPWFHLLPSRFYETILKIFGERTSDLMEIKETGISISRFETIVKQTGFDIVGCKHYLINPIYEFKFKMRPKEQFKVISSVPYFRDFFTTCVYYLIAKSK